MNFSRTLFKRIQKNIVHSNRNYAKSVNPFTRTWGMINDEIKSGFKQKSDYPEHADVVIIGGGFIGSSVAYWLKSRAGEGLSVAVIEKNTTYEMCQNMHSHGILTQHYSLPENIYLSQYSADFLRNIKNNLKEDVDLQFKPHGTLTLASEKYASNLEENVSLLKEYGISNKLLTAEEIQRMYPWINTSDIKLGCISKESEGVFNSQNLLKGLIQKSQELGATYLKSEIIDFEMNPQQDVLMEGVAPGSFKKINRLLYRTEDNQEIFLKFAVCVIAAGSDSETIAKLANIGTGGGLLSVPLPIEKRTYNVYSIENEGNEMSFGLNMPYIMDTSGLWMKRDGLRKKLICGQIPPIKHDTSISDSDVFYSSLHNRYPDCVNSKVKTISTDFIDCNTYDDTGILGPHPYHTNLFFATGFSRQGVQHSPGIGRAVAELIIDCQFTTIDLSRFGFDRILIDEPLIESNVY
ncbi:FAD-dependent oxidoreductase domain-containing protein 1 [Nymphalis io]|uniref:FAD-dependent oxidoreductase domain-containing protein 1 n=1 Tax=Inachis io TaxID=171585 RepID=UPI00216A6A03|nr:FAD-dependent oxidoreductase domain-containing protein 1 [Nymphalis io]